MIFVLKSKWIFLVLAVLLVSQLALAVYLCGQSVPNHDASLVDFTVVIDAGHGGIDGGVTAKNGTRESDLNLQYAKTLGARFQTAGFNVVQTRTTSGGLYGLPTQGFKLRDMQKRKQIITDAHPNVVISIHMNKFSQSVRSGPQVFFQAGSDDGQALARSVQSVLNNFTGNTHSALSGDFFICRESPSPAVIVECGFLSNPDEAAKLQTEAYRTELCDKIFEGIMLYLYSSSQQFAQNSCNSARNHV